MLFLISILLACAFAWFCAKPLRSHPVPFYIGAVVVTVLMAVLGQLHLTGVPAFVSTYVIGMFTRGTFAAALWCVVAWMGALPNGTAAIKHLMPVRGELSIFAAIVTLSHSVTYGIPYLQRLFSGRAGTEIVFVLTCIVSIVLLLIMIPLTVLSFKAIRKKIKPKLWKAIQRTAYGFYALLYLHVMLIFVPRARMGREGAMLSILVYTAVFVGYAVMRIYKYIVVKRKPESRAALRSVCAACFALVFFGMGFASRPVKPVHSAENTQETAASETDLTEAVSESESLTETAEAAPTAASSESTEATTETEASESETAEETSEAQTESAEQPADPAEVIADEPAPAAEPIPAAEPEPVYLYNNGTYHVDIFGYDADEHFDITIENDRIISITGTCDESDPWYFESALPVVSSAIIAANSPDIPDAVSGATISSETIKQAVRNALNMARK